MGQRSIYRYRYVYTLALRYQAKVFEKVFAWRCLLIKMQMKNTNAYELLQPKPSCQYKISRKVVTSFEERPGWGGAATVPNTNPGWGSARAPPNPTISGLSPSPSPSLSPSLSHVLNNTIMFMFTFPSKTCAIVKFTQNFNQKTTQKMGYLN